MSRDFYEKEYHYDEDLVVLDNNRIRHFFKNITLKSKNKYLDIGCGVGWALKYCLGKGLDCVGFDIAERPIRLSRKVLSLDEKILVADGENLPFPSGYFDLVSSLGTIEHFASPDQGLKEIARVLAPGGHALIVVPNSFWVLNKIKFYKGTEQPQEKLATLGEWARFIGRHHLKIEKVSKDIGPRVFKNMHPAGIIKRLLLKLTLMIPDMFAYQFVFIYRKIK